MSSNGESISFCERIKRLFQRTALQSDYNDIGASSRKRNDIFSRPSMSFDLSDDQPKIKYSRVTDHFPKYMTSLAEEDSTKNPLLNAYSLQQSQQSQQQQNNYGAVRSMSREDIQQQNNELRIKQKDPQTKRRSILDVNDFERGLIEIAELSLRSHRTRNDPKEIINVDDFTPPTDNYSLNKKITDNGLSLKKSRFTPIPKLTPFVDYSSLHRPFRGQKQVDLTKTYQKPTIMNGPCDQTNRNDIFESIKQPKPMKHNVIAESRNKFDHEMYAQLLNNIQNTNFSHPNQMNGKPESSRQSPSVVWPISSGRNPLSLKKNSAPNVRLEESIVLSDDEEPVNGFVDDLENVSNLDGLIRPPLKQSTQKIIDLSSNSDDELNGDVQIVTTTRKDISDEELMGKIRVKYNFQTDESSITGSTTIPEIEKVEPINTLRDKLSSKPLFNNDFVTELNRKYSSMNLEHRSKITEEKKIADKIVAETSAVQRLYNRRFDQNWLTTDIIVVDDSSPEPEVDDFPPFNSDQLKIIERAMRGSPDEVLIDKFSYSITRRDIQTLDWNRLAWLNDEVINFYMNLLIERSQNDSNLPKCHAMTTFFIPRLMQGGYSAVRRWTRKVDIFSFDIMPVPVHVGKVHWCMAIVNFRDRSIRYYDSMGSPNHQVLAALEMYLKEESVDKRKQQFDMSGWTKECVQDVPQQQNGSDCGVFSCMFAEFLTRNRPICFSQQHMQDFRRKMVLEIVTGRMIL